MHWRVTSPFRQSILTRFQSHPIVHENKISARQRRRGVLIFPRREGATAINLSGGTSIWVVPGRLQVRVTQ